MYYGDELYDPMEFIDEDGQPRFNIDNYKEVLGPNVVVIEKHQKECTL